MNDINDYFNNESQPKPKRNIKVTVIAPFLCGVLGASLVIGICFGNSTIREKIVGKSKQEASVSTSTSISSPTTNSGVVDYVSLSNYSDTAVGVASKVLPSIVGITVKFDVTSNFGYGMQYSSEASASGSGIIISEDGYILTNNHIVSTSSSSMFYDISEAKEVKVYLFNDETPYDAEIVGKDAQTDIAVIKVNKDGLTPAELSDPSNLKIGEFAMIIGNPLGLRSTVTCGIISGLNREITMTDGSVYSPLIQTDAAINSGNSGGALVNSEGKVIGIATLKISESVADNLGFAIPINKDTTDIYKQLIEFNKVKRPYIGIGGVDVDEKTAQANHLVEGIYIRSVEQFSAAEKAGIQVGDVIIEADNKKVKTMDELTEIKNSKSIGDKLDIKLVRDGEEKTVTVTLGEE